MAREVVGSGGWRMKLACSAEETWKVQELEGRPEREKAERLHGDFLLYRS